MSGASWPDQRARRTQGGSRGHVEQNAGQDETETKNPAQKSPMTRSEITNNADRELRWQLRDYPKIEARPSARKAWCATIHIAIAAGLATDAHGTLDSLRWPSWGARTPLLPVRVWATECANRRAA